LERKGWGITRGVVEKKKKSTFKGGDVPKVGKGQEKTKFDAAHSNMGGERAVPLEKKKREKGDNFPRKVWVGGKKKIAMMLQRTHPKHRAMRQTTPREVREKGKTPSAPDGGKAVTLYENINFVFHPQKKVKKNERGVETKGGEQKKKNIK